MDKFNAQSPLGGAKAQALRAPFIDRWVIGSAVADDVFGFALVVDLLKPLTGTPTFVRAGGWAKLQPNICEMAAEETDIPKEVWKGVIIARRESQAALRQYDSSFYGRHQKALLRGARAWVLKNVTSFSGDKQTLADLAATLGYGELSDVSRMLAPFDHALGKQRRVGAPLGQPHQFRG